VVAAALAETVALPSKCGLAGDVVALYALPGDRAPTSLIAVGGAPAGLYDAARALDWEIPPTGPLAVGAPGAPGGYARLAELGRLGRARLAQPAAALAERGAVWSPLNALLTAESVGLLRRYQPQGCVYDPSPGPHEPGDVVALPGLASVLRAFVERGADLFGGEIGKAVVDTVAQHGGVLTVTDLVPVPLLEEPAHHVQTGGGRLYATNAPTYGHALTEVFSGRAASSVEPADIRAALDALARGELSGGRSCAEGTSTVAAVDAEGNVAVVIHSNSFPRYGSGLVVPEYGLILANRAGRGFAFEPGHPNSPVPGRRPLTTLHGWGAPAPGGGWLLGATPGGEQQVPWNAQLLMQLLRPGAGYDAERIGAALVSPRWTFTAAGTVATEGAELARYGARTSHVVVRSGGAAVLAAADPRWDGAAVAA
jgi:gamma-glutamyltranspeptidase/glutathione hydrolase